MRVIIAGGGTGGHLYPGLAIAEEVVARGGEVLFVGTERGLEARVIPSLGYKLELLSVSGLKAMGFAATARGLGRLPRAGLQSLQILARFKPDLVLGVGGYASGPMVLTAALRGYATALQEQNSVPGVTNRILGRFVGKVLVAFAEAERFFSAKKTLRVGNPVRAAFLRAVAEGVDDARADGARRILVVGGSQGARAVNDLVMGAMAVLAERGDAPTLEHQTGAADAERMAARYQALGFPAGVRSFIDDMAAAYKRADLVIARAGAMTLAELAVLGKPAILIPLPTAADDHQTHNAQAFADAGAAVLAPQAQTTPASLAALIASVLHDDARLRAMCAAMAGLGQPNAARMIVDELVRG